MKKQLLIVSAILSLLTACQTANTAQEREGAEALQQEEGGRVLLSNRSNRNGIYMHSVEKNEMQAQTTKMGYSYRQKNDNRFDRSQIAYVNRETLAAIITDLEVKLPDVIDAATLVTDDEVFIVYRAKTTDTGLVEDQVQKTALSVIPRYYHVYTSTDQKLITQIQSLQSGKLNDTEFTGTVEMLKKQMNTNPAFDDTLKNNTSS